MISLRRLSRFWVQAMAPAMVACHSAEPIPARYPPPPAPAPASPPGGGPQASTPGVCDGQWRAERRGDFDYECRCRVLGPDETSMDGLGQADLVRRMNAASPLTVAVNQGLYEALGLPVPRCGEARVAWRFAATEPAKAGQCRLRGTSEPVKGEDVSAAGELQLELSPGHRERLLGRAAVSAQSSGLGLPTPEPVVSTGEPPLSFSAEPQGRVGFKLQQEGWRSEALAYLPASPMTTALFRPGAAAFGSFQKTFGVSPKDWLERMTVTRESCVIDKGDGPPRPPEQGAVIPGQQGVVTEPIAVNAKVLGSKLVELIESPCSPEGARLKVELTGFPGLAPVTVSGSASIVEDRRRITWLTDPQSAGAGPAALVVIGGTGADRIDVPAPKWLVDAVPCASRQRAAFELQMAAVTGNAGLESSIRASWYTPCADAVMRCRFTAIR